MYKRIGLITLVSALVVAVPFVLMLATNDVRWGLIDFIVAFALLLTPGLIYELIIRRIKKKAVRLGIMAAILLLLVLVWLELSVEIF